MKSINTATEKEKEERRKVYMNKLEHFSRNLELIGAERIKNLEDRQKDEYDIPPEVSFSHKDFKIQFGSAEALEKALGRQFKNRLNQLAGLVGYYGGFCKNYTESKRIRIGENLKSGSEVVATFEDILNNRTVPSPTPSDPTISPLVSKVDFEDKPQVVYISQTAKVVLDAYRTRNAVKNAVRYAEECGLIQCVDGSFRFGSRNNRAKKYAWNKVCEHQLRDLMKNHGVIIPTRFSGEGDPIPEEELESKVNEKELYYKVRIGKGMRTPGLTERDVSAILSRKHRYVLYPMLERLAYYNEGRPDIEKLNFRFNIRITNGYNVKNGCRASSIAGGLKKEGLPKHENDGEYFEDYFRRAYGDEPVEYDVRGSIPRINRLVNFGVWDAWDEDPYTRMFKGFVKSDARRKIAKSMYMLYEFEQSGPKIRASVVRRCPDFTKREGKDEIGQTLEYWYGPILDWQGDSLGSLAFLYEDAVYSKVDVVLKNQGYRFIRKFDCWVFPEGRRPVKSDFEKLVKRCALEWRRGEYERERQELEFLENAGVQELKRHVFQNRTGTDMNSRQFAEYDGKTPENDIPENDIPANDVPVMPMKKKQAPMEKSNGWRKTALKIACRPKDGVLTFKDDVGFIQVDSKKIKEGTDTYRNLLSILQKPDATKWRIRWFSDSNGVRRAVEILTDEQYKEYTKTAWQNRKLYREGFRTANPFLS